MAEESGYMLEEQGYMAEEQGYMVEELEILMATTFAYQPVLQHHPCSASTSLGPIMRHASCAIPRR